MSFGQTLKTWRTKRQISQLDLAGRANVSARHISFLETGRARPSRQMVLQLSRELDIPRHARNGLLAAAGHANAYDRRRLDAADMAPARAAMAWMLDRHAPYPGFAMDAQWSLIEMNAPARGLMAGFGVAPGDSMLEALLSNAALRSALVNLDEVAHHVLARLRVESAHLGGEPVLDAAIARFEDQGAGQTPRDPGVLPAFTPTIYEVAGQRLSLLSTITQFGSAEDILLSDIRIELLFPGDDASRAVLEALAG